MVRIPVPNTIAAVVLAGIGLAAQPTAASGESPIPCGSIYTIERGDTLFKVAERAYADGFLFDRIYQANSEFLPKASSIEIGDQVLVPCLDGTGPQTRRDAIAQGLLEAPGEPDRIGEPDETALAQPMAEPVRGPIVPATLQSPALPSADHAAVEPGALLEKTIKLAKTVVLPNHFVSSPALPESIPPVSFNPTPESATTPDAAEAATEVTPDAPIRLLASSDALPYAGQDLPQGGMIAELLTRAVTAAAPGQPVRVTFVANGSMHLEDLLTDGAFDVGFPWFKPDCGAADLAPSARASCLAFEFSRPLVEMRFGLYARADDPVSRIADDAGLMGKRLCRPGGRFMSDPEQSEMATLPLAVMTAEYARQCFAMLADGQVDVVQMVKPDAAGLIRSMGLSGSVAEIAALESVRMLYAVAHRSSARGTAYLELVDRGLEHLMKSGSWFEVVAAHQSARLALSY